MMIRTNTLLALSLLLTASMHSQAVQYRYEYEKAPVVRSGPVIEEVDDLAALGREAAEDGALIMIAFSTAWCAYCEALEEQVLKPMLVSGNYNDRLLIRKLEANDYSKVIGFDGKPYISEDMALKYRISLYPTLLFLDPEGREIEKRIVGITVLDYIGRDIDEALRKAQRRMRQTTLPR